MRIIGGMCLFLWGLFVTPLSIQLSQRYGIVDLPGGRKMHTTVMPRGAGIVLWLGYLLWALYAVSEYPALRYTVAGGTLVFFAGYWDDMVSVNPFLRFCVHLLAATIVSTTMRIPLPLKIICLVWVAGTTSAYNLIDGANGLCLSLCMVACICFFLLNGSAEFFMLFALCAGVLPWNFPQARTFLGDGGATFIGFLFASHVIFISETAFSSMNPLALILFLGFVGGIPVFDTIFAIVRRLLVSGSPFLPDRGHIHHRILDAGASATVTVCILSCFQAISIAAGVLLLKGEIL
jgi:UDP-GlcNAc:undecaprenyl-phosphate GlcNAc-1-phosphate transferase